MEKAIAAPATVSEYEFYNNHCLLLNGKGKTRLIHEPGDLPRTSTSFRWESDNLLCLFVFILAERLGLFYYIEQFRRKLKCLKQKEY